MPHTTSEAIAKQFQGAYLTWYQCGNYNLLRQMLAELALHAEARNGDVPSLLLGNEDKLKMYKAYDADARMADWLRGYEAFIMYCANDYATNLICQIEDTESKKRQKMMLAQLQKRLTFLTWQFVASSFDGNGYYSTIQWSCEGAFLPAEIVLPDLDGGDDERDRIYILQYLRNTYTYTTPTGSLVCHKNFKLSDSRLENLERRAWKPDAKNRNLRIFENDKHFL